MNFVNVVLRYHFVFFLIFLFLLNFHFLEKIRMKMKERGEEGLINGSKLWLTLEFCLTMDIDIYRSQV